MKKKVVDIIVFVVIFICSMSLIITQYLSGLDEIWQYNFSRCISEGLIPYRDFNLVTTPFYSMLGGLFILIFGNSLFVMRIFEIFILSTILFLAYKILNLLDIKKNIIFIFIAILFSLFLDDIGVEYNYLILIITLLLTYIELRDEGKNGKINIGFRYNILIGLLAGCAIITKHTIGTVIAIICIFYKALLINKADIKEYLKIVGIRILGAIIPVMLFILYLCLNNALFDFYDYCILGVKTFTNSKPYSFIFNSTNWSIRIFAILAPITIITQIVIFIKKTKLEKYKQVTVFSYAIASFIGIYPIANSGHFIISGFPMIILTLYYVYLGGLYLLNKIKNKEKFKQNIEYVCIFIVLVVVLISLEKLIRWKINLKDNSSNINHFRNIAIEENLKYDIERTIKYIKEQNEEGKTVYVLDAWACLYMIPLDKYNKNYDLFLVGNLGKDGQEGQIRKIENEIKNNNINILIKSDKFSRNWQNPEEVRQYIINNLNKTGTIGMYDIYE